MLLVPIYFLFSLFFFQMDAFVIGDGNLNVHAGLCSCGLIAIKACVNGPF